ncbi:preprotein translocase subunit SecA [Acidovorax sp. Be4]|uniref:Preprotein translocase subunit SecA n=1 Tax=Acidovorax bellezanensis TaxID=2976702 RepID=A0ABT2PKR6_9BURK|nr:preprotein translocase subunit SecA [Acidovorax sp. Be4]MCT9811062.1 preprotein translocase subunit SecA [Acidovorax sp. Be4]
MHQFTTMGTDALYPIKECDRPANPLQAWGTAGLRWLGRQWRGPLWRTRRILAQVHRETQALGRLDLAGVRERAAAVGFDLRCNGMNEASVARAFALIRQAGQLTLGKAHFDVQLLGGWAMLQGMVAEMNTGEGKTLTATLPAATAAMAGLPVHVITINDYLVERDAQRMAPLYAALGLSVAWVSMEMGIPERRQAYQADIVYCSHKTLVFDYLRDLIVLDQGQNEDPLRLARLRGGAAGLEPLCLRGLCFAIVDEADSVLVDEARTPVTISGQQEADDSDVPAQAMGQALTAPRTTLKSISYQRFFRHYLHLAGMTGTAAEIRAELGRVYNLPVVRIPPHREPRRLRAPDRVSRSTEEKWQAVCERTRELHARGVPVLIGTRSVAASAQVSQVLAAAGLPAVVLNAKQDQDEATLIALAGTMGSIMVATDMAGRGTDIPLTPPARAAGGLHVILTERHASARIDRQLEGRSGRQGDPGHTEAILCLEDAILDGFRDSLRGRLGQALLAVEWAGWNWLAARWIDYAQACMERKLARERRQMVSADEEFASAPVCSRQGG